MYQVKIDLRIGELLIKAGILTDAELQKAIRTAETSGLPIGRVLVMAGYITDQVFQAAVQAQSLVRDEILPLDSAIAVLKLVEQDHIDLEAALEKSKLSLQTDRESNKLGELLLESGIIPQDGLERAMRTSAGTGLPLGRLLISFGLLSDEALATALNAQTLIRAGRLTRTQAINGMKAAFARRRSLDAALIEQGFYRGHNRPYIRLGELFVRSGIISREEVDLAVITSLVNAEPFGQVLEAMQFVDKLVLDEGLQLQEMVANETLTIDEAIIVLRKIHATECSLPEALSLLELTPDRFKTRVRYVEVMKVAGLVAPGEERFDNSDADPSSSDAQYTARTLVQDGIIDKRVYFGSLRCYHLIAIGWLTMQQGIIALNYFHHKECSFDEVLQELKWTVRTYMRRSEMQNS